MVQSLENEASPIYTAKKKKTGEILLKKTSNLLRRFAMEHNVPGRTFPEI